MTYDEIKTKLSICEKALTLIKTGSKTGSKRTGTKQKIQELNLLKEGLKKKLLEVDGGTVTTDDEAKAEKLASKGIDVNLTAEATGVEFGQNETGFIAKATGKALAKSLKDIGDQLGSMKAIRIQPNSFDIAVIYKGEAAGEDEFSFDIENDKLIISDFTFSKVLVDVGVKGSGEPIINVDVLANEFTKHFKSLNEEDIEEAPYGRQYIEVSIRDARKALDILDDTLNKSQFEMNGSNVYYFAKPSTAYDALMDFRAHDVEILDTNADDEEEDLEDFRPDQPYNENMKKLRESSFYESDSAKIDAVLKAAADHQGFSIDQLKKELHQALTQREGEKSSTVEAILKQLYKFTEPKIIIRHLEGHNSDSLAAEGILGRNAVPNWRDPNWYKDTFAWANKEQLKVIDALIKKSSKQKVAKMAISKNFKDTIQRILDKRGGSYTPDEKVEEGRGDGATIFQIIRDRAAEDGVSEKEAAMEVLEAIGEEYEINFEFGRIGDTLEELDGDTSTDSNAFAYSKSGVSKIQKEHDVVISVMKDLAKKYKAGDKSVVSDLKLLTKKKNYLEDLLDAKVSGTGKDQQVVGEGTDLYEDNFFQFTRTNKGQDGMALQINNAAQGSNIKRGHMTVKGNLLTLFQKALAKSISLFDDTKYQGVNEEDTAKGDYETRLKNHPESAKIKAIQNLVKKQKQQIKKEGYYGTSEIETIVGAIGYDDIDHFFEDNPGAVDAIIQMIGSVPEFNRKLGVEFSTSELADMGFYDIEGYDKEEGVEKTKTRNRNTSKERPYGHTGQNNRFFRKV